MEKPTVVISGCLAGEKVRYDGKAVEDGYVKKLSQHLNLIKVCPEVEIGLSVPRKKVFLYKNGGLRLIEEGTGKDYTKKMERFSEGFLKNLPEVDGFLLKGKSPSCGITGAKTYKNRDRTGYAGRYKGLFARQVLERFRDYPVADEVMLKNPYHRYKFLTLLYLINRFKNTEKEDFMEKYLPFLRRVNRRGSERFEKEPSLENLLRLFRKKPDRKKVEELVREGVFVFPKELFYP
ncbi:MAG: DUF523 domain-containing protein [Aquificae bacterium]|nr:DUF523 domain-containing protein [Aquificota bacterium]